MLIVKSDESDSLAVAFFKRETRANHSNSLFYMSNYERKSEERNSEFPTLLHILIKIKLVYLYTLRLDDRDALLLAHQALVGDGHLLAHLPVPPHKHSAHRRAK